MVFLLDDTLIDNINNENNFNTFFRLLMISYVEGKHIIVISPKNVKLILDRNILDEQTKIYLNHYSLHNKAAIQNLTIFDKICKIVASNIEETYLTELSSGKQYWLLTIKNFLDTANFQKTILLGENGNDIKIYALMADFYRNQANLTSFKLSYKIQSGGGSTIDKEYETIHKTNEEFCHCIMDCDKRTPTKGLGNTAKGVTKYHKQNYDSILKCSYHILEVMEIENLLPKRFYIDYYENHQIDKRGTFEKIEKLLEFDANAIFYVDFKKGLKSFSEYEDFNFLEYWCSLILQSNTKCDICVDTQNNSYIYFHGYGDKITIDFISLNEDVIFQFVESSEVNDVWLEIGKHLSSYIFGTPKIRAI